mmetsp:Transcript_1375/g.4358  ORF Transcript_1375/g.4358 Transcript_1375/m.4358 type:complete len:152 (+) Transcript_1375:32-487(+)
MAERAEESVRLGASRIVLLHELAAGLESMLNEQVRFVGRLSEISSSLPRATLSVDRASVIVDTSHLSIDQHPSRIGSLYSIIGEVDFEDAQETLSNGDRDIAAHEHGREWIVRARLTWCVDGLDMNLWTMALPHKRAYDARLAQEHTTCDD